MFPWIDIDKYPYSAAQLFLQSLKIPQISSPCNVNEGRWKVYAYKGGEKPGRRKRRAELEGV